jgi:hypothetical protein
MAARAGRLLLCLLGVAKTAQAEPLVSTDIIYSTHALMTSLASVAYEKAGGDALLDSVQKQVPMGLFQEAAKKKQAELEKLLPPEAKKTLSEFTDAAVKMKKVVYEQTTKYYGELEKLTDVALSKVESSVPLVKGRIGKGPANVAMFVLYVGFVLLYVFKIAMFVLRLAKDIFCCICCCGCCSRKKPTPETTGKNGKKANGAAKKAAEPKPDPKAKAKADPKAKGKAKK